MTSAGTIRESGALVALDDRLTAEWAALHDACAASPFLHPDLIGLWAAAFDAGAITLATVRRDGELVAALPLLRRGARLASAANWHTVETGLLARDASAAAALAAALFADRPRRLSLEFLSEGDGALLREAASRAGYRVFEQTQIESPYLDLDGDWAAYEASLSSRRRSEMRRLRRRLGEAGELERAVVERGDAVAPLLDELLTLEAASWKAAQGTAIAQHGETRRFYGDLVAWAAERGWLRLLALRLDGRAVAISLGLEAHGVFYGMKAGSDAARRRLSPGIVLLDEVVQDAFERGLTRVEMLGDDDRYKRAWCRAAHARIGLTAYAPSLAGRTEQIALTLGRGLARRLRGRLSRRGPGERASR